MISAQNFQVSNDSIKLTCHASTVTVPSIENSTYVEIVIINQSPIIQYSGDPIIILIDKNLVI